MREGHQTGLTIIQVGEQRTITTPLGGYRCDVVTVVPCTARACPSPEPGLLNGWCPMEVDALGIGTLKINLVADRAVYVLVLMFQQDINFERGLWQFVRKRPWERHHRRQPPTPKW